MPPSLQDLSAKLDTMKSKADEKDNDYKEAMEKNDKMHTLLCILQSLRSRKSERKLVMMF